MNEKRIVEVMLRMKSKHEKSPSFTGPLTMEYSPMFDDKFTKQLAHIFLDD